MSKLLVLQKKPLGEILKEAGLISDPQIQIALRDQALYVDKPLGEILALRGWIKPETADFFADELKKLSQQRAKQKIGYYLNKAALLTPEQIKEILRQQQKIRAKFGTLAVQKGWLKQTTVDFFLTYFCEINKSNSSLQSQGKIIYL